MDSLRALVIDDTSSYRALLSSMLNSLPGVDVLGAAATASTGLARAKTQTPDLILIDAALADTSMADLVSDLRDLDDGVGIVLIGETTRPEPDTTTLAADLAALGAIGRPDLGDDEGQKRASSELRRLIDGFHTRRLLRGTGARTPAEASSPSSPSSSPSPSPSSAPSAPSPAPARSTARTPAPLATTVLLPDLPLDAVAIGISTGGPNALAEMLPALPGDLPVPIFLVQHITDTFTASLVKSLDAKCRLVVREGEDELQPLPGHVYIAPGGHQMKVESAEAGPQLRLTDDPPVNHCKPAVDYLFLSVAAEYGARALGVIMTGMGADGTAGLVAMHKAGARVLAQDEASSLIYGMPGAAVNAGVVDLSLSLDHLASEITRLVMHGRARS